MKKILFSISCLLFLSAVHAQDDVYPTKEYKGRLFITNGTVHVGNGQVIENGTIEINNGKIVAVGQNITPSGDAKVVDAKGQQVYPGMILPVTDLGLKEIANGVRGSNDFQELGDFNPSVRSINAYNTDSKVINTLKSNGILLAGVTPQGGTISGSSSVVQLDAWNWEDAAYKMDNAIHLNMPSFIDRPRRGFFTASQGAQQDPSKKALEKIEEIKSFFRQAKAYDEESSHKENNLKFEAVKGLFTKKQKLFVHADQVKQMLAAIEMKDEFGFDMVLVGASESWQIADLLKQKNIAVILNQPHALPSTEDDDFDQPYKTPAMLQKEGVLFAINDEHDESRYRNLPFDAGTAAAYGLGKEGALQAITLNTAKILGVDDRTGSIEAGKEGALQAITLNTAKILGIDDRTGSIEAGKDANIVISTGDILDMRTSNITHAFIQGRDVNLDNKQKQLYERYKTKYGLADSKLSSE